MDAFEETVQKAKEVFNVACKKTGEVVTLQKQKIDLAALENKANKEYAKLGKLQFDAIKDTEIEDPETASLVLQIKGVLFDADQLRQQINKAQGKIECPACKMMIAATSTYCSFCGEKITPPAEEQPADSAEQAEKSE